MDGVSLERVLVVTGTGTLHVRQQSFFFFFHNLFESKHTRSERMAIGVSAHSKQGGRIVFLYQHGRGGRSQRIPTNAKCYIRASLVQMVFCVAYYESVQSIWVDTMRTTQNVTSKQQRQKSVSTQSNPDARMDCCNCLTTGFFRLLLLLLLLRWREREKIFRSGGEEKVSRGVKKKFPGGVKKKFPGGEEKVSLSSPSLNFVGHPNFGQFARGNSLAKWIAREKIAFCWPERVTIEKESFLCEFGHESACGNGFLGFGSS